MKLTALMPLLVFIASVVSCGAPEEVASETSSEIVTVSQAVSTEKDKCDKCTAKCDKQTNKKDCIAKCKCGGGPSCAPAMGQPCGCENQGVFLCNGTCSIVSPINPDCDTCGGETLCNGQCSIPLPRDYNLPCGCGGRFLCNATCSIPCNNN